MNALDTRLYIRPFQPSPLSSVEGGLGTRLMYVLWKVFEHHILEYSLIGYLHEQPFAIILVLNFVNGSSVAAQAVPVRVGT